MTREEAKAFGLSLLNGIMERNNKSYPIYADNVKQAIEALSAPELPSELEEAAKTYSEQVSNGHHFRDLECGFIAGAEYQRKQDQQLIELAEDHAMLAGMNKMKEEMMEKAVEHYVIGVIAGSPVGPAIVHYDENLNIGDKVKVIVIPENSEKVKYWINRES